MADVLVEFDTVLTADDGTRWTPRACGREGDAGRWKGWIEFLSMEDSQPAIRTQTESTQPNRDDLMYWAQGLSTVFLDGALERAQAAPRIPVERAVARTLHFDGPAARAPSGQGGVIRPKPVLNPFEVYQQGQSILLQELRALSIDRLRDITLAYEFASQAGAHVASREELTAIIVGGVLNPSGSERAPDDLTLPR